MQVCGRNEEQRTDMGAVEPEIKAASKTETGEPPRAGSFLYHRADDRWEWSEAVACMHGYKHGTISPTTDLVQSHQHPDDRSAVAQTLLTIRTCGGQFSSRHRIVDTGGRIKSVVMVGKNTQDEHGQITGSAGFYIEVTDILDESAVRESIDEAVAQFVRSRGVIEQAKGILMVVYGIPADRAFDILVWRSQETNVKVREMAERLVTLVLADFDVPDQIRTRFHHLLLTM